MPGSITVASERYGGSYASKMIPSGAPMKLRPGDECQQDYLLPPGGPEQVMVRIRVLWIWSRDAAADEDGLEWREFRVGLLRIKFCLCHPG